MARVYVAQTWSGLAGWLRAGATEVAVAHAVTEALRAALPGADDDELEYEALRDAADRSAGLLAGADATSGGEPARRVVVAIDVATPQVSERADAGASVVSVTGTLRWSDVASVHVDEPSAAELVLAGDQEALDLVDLLWYSPEEMAALVGNP